MSLLIVYCSVPDDAVAERIARTLVEERLAACVTRLPNGVSTYRWQGEVLVEPELLLLIKTTRAVFKAVSKRVTDLHPYSVPELIAVDVVDALPAYAEWVKDALIDST
ncbi:MAG: divalent-cation tolerance protein CutA [Dokdonella sp.]